MEGFLGYEMGGADTDPHDRPLAKLYDNDKGFMGEAEIIDCGVRKFFLLLPVYCFSVVCPSSL